MPNVGEAAYQSGSERGLWSEPRAQFPVLPLPKRRLTQGQVLHLSKLQLPQLANEDTNSYVSGCCTAMR